MKILRFFFLFVLIMLPLRPAFGEVFRYYDEEGTLIVTDNPFGQKKRGEAKNPPTGSGRSTVTIDRRADVSYEFYAVSGGTIHDAMAATEREGPLDPREGRRYAGQTKWNFGLSYNLEISYLQEGEVLRASLQVRDVNLISDITVILPELSDESSFSYHELRAWEDFVRHLAAHEHDHVRIIRDPRFSREFYSGVAAIPLPEIPLEGHEEAAQSVRGAVESEVEAVAHRTMRRIKEVNDEYDSLTDHGRKPELAGPFMDRL